MKKRKPNRRDVRSKKADEEEQLQELERRAMAEAPKHGSVACPATEFKQLPLSDATMAGLAKGGFSHMTEIQRTSMPHALAGRDLQGGARTGSGKTLAFLVPMLERLYRARWSRMDGLGALIISPTRELALQIFDVLRVVGSSHAFSAGLVIGGKDVRSEQELINTMNVLVATPGRLLQHMDETPGFDCSSLMVLILDEADRMLDMGFEKTMNGIVENLPKGRQTLLFSATLTKSVKALARLSLSRDAEIIGVHDKSAKKLAKGEDSAEGGGTDRFDMPRKLSHSYLVCDLDKKLNVLYSFAKTHLKCKIIVFLSSCKQTKFFYEAIRRARPGLSVMCMHGRMKQMKRMAAYCRFCESTGGSMLLATDIAARGLDFPNIDWVVQLDCPEDTATYIHRSGRTARYRSSGRSLLFLLPSEKEAMLAKMETDAKIVPRQVSMNAGKSFDLQESLAGWVAADPDLKFLAQKAFVTFVRSYFLQKDKDVFDVGALPLEEYAAALGLPGAPRIRLVKKTKKSKEAGARGAGTSSDEEEGDGEAAAAAPVRQTAAKDSVAKLMKRKNVGVLSDSRAALREDEPSDDDDSDDDLMQMKRRNHDLPGAGTADFEAEQKADLKKMSRKQRKLAKQIERGEAPEEKDAHTMEEADTGIDGWQDQAVAHAAEVKDRLADMDSSDKSRERDRVRAKHRQERAARKAWEAEREGRGAGGAEPDEENARENFTAELGSSSDEAGDEEEGEEEAMDYGAVVPMNKAEKLAAERRSAGGTFSSSEEEDDEDEEEKEEDDEQSDDDVDSEASSDEPETEAPPAKRRKAANPADLQAIAAQLLQSRSLI